MSDTASMDESAPSAAANKAVKTARLSDRGVIRVAGADARHFLQGLVTQDLDGLDHERALFAALLSPQGKILFDFFVVRSADALLLDVAHAKIEEFVKRLTLYRLRARVNLEVMRDFAVYAVWGPEGWTSPSQVISYRDPRFRPLGWRAIVPDTSEQGWVSGDVTLVDNAEWHAHRVRLGVPEGGVDFAFADAFPHEADMDQLNGISFSKGCYVGQEVVSRMQHRGTARKRFVQVLGTEALARGAAVTAGGAQIGALASVDGMTGLALLRLDRAAEAGAKGEPLMALGARLTLVKPVWATFDLNPPAREQTHDL